MTMTTHRISWVKCGQLGETYCNLGTVSLDLADYDGVYIIWNTDEPRVLVVGQGNITTDLQYYREDDPTVLAYLAIRPKSVFVTWARVPDRSLQEGAVSYLWSKYQPQITQNPPVAPPIEVNLPGS